MKRKKPTGMMKRAAEPGRSLRERFEPSRYTPILVALCAAGWLLAWAHPAFSAASFQAKLTAPTTVAQQRIGSSVAVDGDTVLLSDPRREDNGYYSGAVWVFTRTAGTTMWTQQAKLLPTDGAEDDSFGSAIALSGDTAAIGAPWRDCFDLTGLSIPDCGAVYIFVRNGSSWSQDHIVLGTHGSGAGFG